MENNNINKILESTKDLKVLYIEDNKDVREQTLKMLQIFFDSISVARDGQEGIDIYKENKDKDDTSFDLIITDLEMPVLDGMSMIDEIRELNKDIPILIFSAHSNADYFLRTINAGIDGYILKPYNIEQISNSLMNIIEKNKLSNKTSHIVHLDEGFKWDIRDSILYKGEDSIKLTKNEMKLFNFFINSKGALKTYDEIELHVFEDTTSSSKRVRNLVSRLKTKLETDIFESIYSHGYKLKYKNFV